MMQPQEVQQLIEAGLPDAQVFVEGDGAHFTALVVSVQFIGKSRIQKQQLVYDTVRPYLLDGRLHALSVRAYSPEEWQALDTGES